MKLMFRKREQRLKLDREFQPSYLIPEIIPKPKTCSNIKTNYYSIIRNIRNFSLANKCLVHNSISGLEVDLYKSKFQIQGMLLFPLYYITFSTYDQILIFCWFPSGSCYHSNGDGKRKQKLLRASLSSLNHFL